MITVYGTVCVDNIRRVERLPRVGGYVDIISQDTLLGGEAANTAMAVRRLGADVVLFGNPIGEDAGGGLIRGALATAGLTTKFATGASTPFCDVYVTDIGERTMFGYGFIGIGDRSPVPDITKDSGWVTVDGNLGDAARRVVARSQDAGCPVYAMDCEPSAVGLRPGNWWQTSTHFVDTPREAADRSRASGCWGVLTDGARGIHVINPKGQTVFLPAFHAGHVLDSTGAGDVFRGGFLAGLDGGLPVIDAAIQGMAVGCLNCRALGGHQAAPTMMEVRDLFDEQPDVVEAARRAWQSFAVSS